MKKHLLEKAKERKKEEEEEERKKEEEACVVSDLTELNAKIVQTQFGGYAGLNGRKFPHLNKADLDRCFEENGNGAHHVAKAIAGITALEAVSVSGCIEISRYQLPNFPDCGPEYVLDCSRRITSRENFNLSCTGNRTTLALHICDLAYCIECFHQLKVLFLKVNLVFYNFKVSNSEDFSGCLVAN